MLSTSTYLSTILEGKPIEQNCNSVRCTPILEKFLLFHVQLS